MVISLLTTYVLKLFCRPEIVLLLYYESRLWELNQQVKWHIDHPSVTCRVDGQPCDC